jgi:polar amino acid transport system substrate-binding protein
MRIIRTLVVSLVVVGLMAGYSQIAFAAEGARVAPVLDRILAKQELVVGTAASMPPLNMTMKDGQIIGLEVDLARFLADGLGVKLTLKGIQFNQLIPALEAGQVDMILSGMTITPARNPGSRIRGTLLCLREIHPGKKASIESMKFPRSTIR